MNKLHVCVDGVTIKESEESIIDSLFTGNSTANYYYTVSDKLYVYYANNDLYCSIPLHKDNRYYIYSN